jgi:hypothetical protein
METQDRSEPDRSPRHDKPAGEQAAPERSSGEGSASAWAQLQKQERQRRTERPGEGGEGFSADAP